MLEAITRLSRIDGLFCMSERASERRRFEFYTSYSPPANETSQTQQASTSKKANERSKPTLKRKSGLEWSALALAAAVRLALPLPAGEPTTDRTNDEGKKESRKRGGSKSEHKKKRPRHALA